MPVRLALVPGLPRYGPPPAPNRAEHPYHGTILWPYLPLILVETARGEIRHGRDVDGKPWSTTMTAHYGEFQGTKGADGDPVDVFVGEDKNALWAYVIHQKIPNTEVYDEDKVIIGVPSAQAAEILYRQNFGRPGFFAGMTRWPLHELGTALRDPRWQGRRLDRPAAVRALLNRYRPSPMRKGTRLVVVLHKGQQRGLFDPPAEPEPEPVAGQQGLFAQTVHVPPYVRDGKVVAGHDKIVHKKPRYFASGSNHPGEMAGFAEIGHPFGVAVQELGEAGLERLLQLGREHPDLTVFLDSGAFSEVEIGEDGRPMMAHPITPDEWRRRLDIYRRVGEVYGARASVVAPDQIGSQEGSLQRLRDYRAEIAAVAATGAEVLVPLPGGDLDLLAVEQAARSALGGIPFTPALPLKKKALTAAQVGRYVSARQPPALHLLGLGPDNKAAAGIIDTIWRLSPHTAISMDSNLIRANVGKTNGPGGAPRSFTLAQDLAKRERRGEVWTEQIEKNGLRVPWEVLRTPSKFLPEHLRGPWADALMIGRERALWMSDPDEWMARYGEQRLADPVFLESVMPAAVSLLSRMSPEERKRRGIHLAFGTGASKVEAAQGRRVQDLARKREEAAGRSSRPASAIPKPNGVAEVFYHPDKIVTWLTLADGTMYEREIPFDGVAAGMFDPLQKALPAPPRPGLVLLAGPTGARRWRRIEPSEVHVGAAWDTPRGRLEVLDIDGERATLARNGGSRYRMPLASVPQHVHDSRRELPHPPTAGDVHIDGVLRGEGEYLDKGNDGIVYRSPLGSHVVKVSTTSPYQWENAGHRTPEGAVEHLRGELVAHQAHADLPHIPPVHGQEHDGRFWLVKPYLSEVGRLTRGELDALTASLEEMHRRGWALNDQIQLGRDAAGAVRLMDLGLARPGAAVHQQQHDRERLDQLYREHGERRLPAGEELVRKEKVHRTLLGFALKGGDPGRIRTAAIRWKELLDARQAELAGGDLPEEGEEDPYVTLHNETKDLMLQVRPLLKGEQIGLFGDSPFQAARLAGSGSIQGRPGLELRPGKGGVKRWQRIAPRSRIGLVSCSDTKDPEGKVRAIPADQLYGESALYREATGYVQRPGGADARFILSAKHGLVHPEDPLEDYNETIPRNKPEVQRAWGQKVIDQMEAGGLLGQGHTWEIHAGQAYTGGLVPLLRERGERVEEPARGLSMLQRRSFYKRHRDRLAS